ncbi:MAG: hypothetical protein CYG61_09990 [Actinobacteria bacterium]|nr:MAG: hypothetical protein CYG61_09990 [Actinomycetota bacterium]
MASLRALVGAQGAEAAGRADEVGLVGHHVVEILVGAGHLVEHRLLVGGEDLPAGCGDGLELSLEGEGDADFLMAWVSVPDLGLHPSIRSHSSSRRSQPAASESATAPTLPAQRAQTTMGLVDESSVLRSVGSTAVSVDLVGREVELAHLREALDAACAGEGGVVFLVGEAGIGKSRLAEAVASDSAARGLPMLRGRAIQTATPAPYRPLAEALSSAVRAGIAPELTEVNPFRAILGRLVPEWRRDDHGPLDESQVAVAEAVLRLLRATAGESGVVLVLEDLHWADPETVTAVEYLADNLSSERVLCVVTVREGHGGKGTDLAEVLRCRRAAPVLHLAPLGEREVTAMVASCLGAATISDDVVALAARAEGVPFIVEELLTTAVSTGALVQEAGSWMVAKRVEAVVPATFAESIRRRLGELGDDGERVVVAAAVLGRQFD